MAGTYADSSLVGKSPQYAYALAILSGGIAFGVTQLGDTLTSLFFYALLAALFAFIWPGSSVHWAGWLCLPIVLLLCFDLISSFSVYRLQYKGMIFAKAFSIACLGAFIGSKLSVRKIAGRGSHMRASRRRAGREAHTAQNALASTQPRKFTVSAKPAFSSLHPDRLVEPLEPVATIQNLNAELIKAAQQGDVEKIGLLAAQGADVNAKSKDQFTPLMIAAMGGDQEMVNTLFGSGAATDAAGFKGWTALMVATVEGRAEVARALIKCGAEVNARNDAGWTAMRFAVSMGETEILRLLISAGAEVDAADDEGRTALMQAACEDNLESLRALLDAGANPRVRDKEGQSALKFARRHGHTNTIRLLKEAEAKTSTGDGGEVGLPSDDTSYFYLLKEELEEKLNYYPEQSAGGHEVFSLVRSALRSVQEHIDATQKERLLTPSEISHKLLLTVQEASTLSGLPRQHLLAEIEAGKLRAQLLKHGWRIRRADLDSYVRGLTL
jgi:excisionase family DNA binding protein